MIKPTAVIFCAAVLVGCTTTKDIKKNNPTVIAESNKYAKEVTSCIAYKWENAPFFSKLTGMVSTGITANGYSVIAYGKNWIGIWPVLISEIDETKTGSLVKYYTSRPLIDESHYTDAISTCK